jgi:hypothetical protein
MSFANRMYTMERHSRHEFSLHHSGHLVIAGGPLPEQRVDLVNEDLSVSSASRSRIAISSLYSAAPF